MTKNKFKISIPEVEIQDFEFTESLSIGSFGQDVNLDNEQISTRHCTFNNDDGILSLCDNESLQGTFVNGERLGANQPVIVTTYDKITLGNLKVVLLEAQHSQVVPDLPGFESIEEQEGDELLDQFIQIHPPGSFNNNSHEEKTIKIEKTQIFSPSKLPEYANEDETLTKTNLVNLEIEKKEMPEDAWGIPFLLRLIILFFDFHICLFLLFFFTEQQILLPSSFKEISFIESLMPGSSQFLLFFISIFILYKVICAFFFRMSLGKLLGQCVCEGSNDFKSRIMAVFRSLLGSLTLPLIILDIPTFSSLPSVEERITNSRLGVHSKVKSYAVMIPMFFISFLVAFIFPIIGRSDFKSPLIDLQSSRVVGKSTQNDKFMGSSYFGFSKLIRSKIFLEYPEFQIVKQEERRSIRPGLRIYYPQEKMFLSLFKGKKIDFDKVLNFATRLNPLAFLYFPETIKKVKKRPYQKDLFEQELQRLVKNSLELKVGNLLSHFFTYGPFFKSFLDFQDSFSATIGQKIQRISFIDISGQSFISVLFDSFDEKKEAILIAMEDAKANNLKFEMETLGAKKIQMENFSKFLRHFLLDSKWEVVSNNELNAFSLIDWSSRDLKGIDEKNIFQYYFHLARRLVRTKNETIYQDFLKKLEGLMSIILDKKDQKERLDLLSEKITELVGAYKNKDFDYFGIN